MSPEAGEEKVDRRRGPRTTESVPEPTPQYPKQDLEELKAQLKAQLKAEILAEQKADEEASKVYAETPPDPIPEVDPTAAGAVTVNFTEDGMTWLGQIWYAGQELTVLPGSKQWEELTDPKTGKLLLLLTENEQIIRWGRRMFREGKWHGAGYDLDDPALSDEDRARLRAIQGKRAQAGLAPGAGTKKRLFQQS